MNKIYIGVSGFARSGKNLFCDIAQKVLKEKYNLTSKTYALAYFLKKDCEPFIQEKLGLSAFSEKTEDKNAFREMLVWYGGVKRKQTELCKVFLHFTKKKLSRNFGKFFVK